MSPKSTTIKKRVGPQPGPQTDFLASPADIAIYGGAAGGGKTFALLLETLRHINNPKFGAVFFRRTTPQIRNEGALWDESFELYPALGGIPKENALEWHFPSGATVSMRHLEYDKTVNEWQGAQIPLIIFDELTHFTEKQFFYLTSRNRSGCGVRPYIRCSCNPDADSWVRRFIDWWIGPDGYPIPERAGKIRYYVRIGDAIIWGSTRAELAGYKTKDGKPIRAKSVTFIPAKLSDNKALLAANPDYEASLLGLTTVERERLLYGNWNIRAAAGLLFKRKWVRIVDAIPAGTVFVRGWDLAATPKTEATPDPDATAGTLIGRAPDGRFIVADCVHDWLSPSGVETLIKNTASHDGKSVRISIPQDPAQAGKSQRVNYSKMLAGYDARFSPESGDKVTRFSPFSAQAENGNVDVLRGNWNEDWFRELEGFPPPDKAGHDDIADSTSRAYNELLDSGYQYRISL